ncbi:MAG: tyrosine--tRNA ligase [Candidatus Ryanbacteria bacterium RIFCSPHIGHO2_01_FULL_48_80]|nr:MAG: tyrosine--tRNA ligase [Candidatus Ryanbacteria bacterium RIFCSPHIGHO2_01_FULL_48_80]
METGWYSKLWARGSESFAGISPGDFLALVRPKCKQIITEDSLRALLSQKKKLRVKLGTDVTGADLHLGHAVPLMLLRLFQRAGHEVHFIVGDFTGKIGDPSGRMDRRLEQSDAEIRKNMKTYTAQISPLLDIKKAKIHKNSTWLSKMPLGEFLRIVGSASFGAVAQREDFRMRFKTGSPVSLREANYAALMAIDSLQVHADVEVGALDQLLNFMQTRDIMAGEGLSPETICVTPLIEGTSGDGRKMSKSFGNYIALSDTPENQFGLVMSIPDGLIKSYFVSFGDVYEQEVKELAEFIQSQPLEAKKQLGTLVVALLHGDEAARLAREDFERKFSRKEYKKEDERIVFAKLPNLVVRAIDAALRGELSSSEVRRLIKQGAVRKSVDGEFLPVESETETIKDGDLIKIGKRNILRFKNGPTSIKT